MSLHQTTPSLAYDDSGAQRWPQPAISWAAIVAGASVAIAVSLVLSLAAAGLGFTVGYPGLATRGSLSAFSPMVGAGAIVIQVLSSALGGFIAGRLRTTWVGVHGDESHFRDTAHGLVTWAVATVVGVILAITVLAPYADRMALASAAITVDQTPGEIERAANIAAQSALFIAIGMLLSAFVASIAARLGGMEHEAMYERRIARSTTEL